MFYNFAPLILAALGILAGLTGFYFDIIYPIRDAWLLWVGISSALSIAGFIIGRFVRKLNVSSHTDFLTGLWNRRYFQLRLYEEEARATRKATPFCVVMIDVDDFKTINDSNGHAAGDILLSGLAAIFKENTRATDVVSRWGGDEFAIIFSDTSLEHALAVMERIRRKVELAFSCSYRLTISVGIISVEPGQDLENFLIRADQALYKAKTQKNSVITVTSF